MHILGIDPGYGRVGWAIIKTEKNKLELVEAGTFETIGKYEIKSQTKLSKRKSQVDKLTKNKISLDEYRKFNNQDIASVETPLLLRINEIVVATKELFQKFQIDEVAIESLFFFKNQKTVMQVSQARGAILQTCLELIDGEYWKIAEYTPLQVKQNLTGAGRAEKSQVAEMVKRILKIDKKDMPKLDDAIDAIAIAMTHASNIKYSRSSLK